MQMVAILKLLIMKRAFLKLFSQRCIKFLCESNKSICKIIIYLNIYSILKSMTIKNDEFQNFVEIKYDFELVVIRKKYDENLMVFR